VDGQRLEELRRRVARDPATIAFAQLAEEYRRAGDGEEAIRVALAGLAHHPDYVSARVTLGRALLERGRHQEARTELERASQQAPDNLAASCALLELNQWASREAASHAPGDAPDAGSDVVASEPATHDSVIDSAISAIDSAFDVAIDAGTVDLLPAAATPAGSEHPPADAPVSPHPVADALDRPLPSPEAPVDGALAGLDDWMQNLPGAGMRDSAPAEPALDAADLMSQIADLPPPAPAQAPVPDPLEQLDAWLDAIVARREASRRRQD
jgi:tetratricopeptide (TPR) repeat protein